MILLPYLVILSGLDFNFDFEQTLGCSRLLAGNPHAPRQTRFLADHDASASDNFPALRCRASWRSQGQGLHLLGSVPRNGFCATDLSRVASRYRSQSSRTSQASVSHGISLCDAVSQYAGQCERDAALADLCRLCSASDWDCETAVYRRAAGYRSGCNGLRLRRHNDRSVPVDVSVGTFSSGQGRDQTAYSVGPAGRNPKLYQHYGRQDPRGQRPRRPPDRAWGILFVGSRLPRLRTALRYSSIASVLCDTRKIQYKVSTKILSASRSREHSDRLRSDRCADRLLHGQRVSASHSSRCCKGRERQTIDLFDEQLWSQTRTDRSTLSTAMASRIVLQMDQATSENQNLFGHKRERRQDANLDCDLHLRADRNTQETFEIAQQSSRNSTNPEFDHV